MRAWLRRRRRRKELRPVIEIEQEVVETTARLRIRLDELTQEMALARRLDEGARGG